ncbi:hypothetical protein F7725_018161, partial [Dissostichus mawsoni]
MSIGVKEKRRKRAGRWGFRGVDMRLDLGRSELMGSDEEEKGISVPRSHSPINEMFKKQDAEHISAQPSSVNGAEFGHLPDNITVCRIDEEVTHKAWLNRSNILFTGTDKWSLDKRVTLANSNNSDFSIHIDNVQISDEGPYTCTFQANNKPRIAHVYLIVQVPARIVNISKNVSVNEGENVNLFCLAVGRPEPTVTWKDQKYGLVSDGEFLDITEIKREQAEDYECITNNGVSPPDQRKVKVTVNYPPMITDMKNMPVHLGKTTILRCEAMAVPPAAFEWYRDDHRPLESDNTLRIKTRRRARCCCSQCDRETLWQLHLLCLEPSWGLQRQHAAF